MFEKDAGARPQTVQQTYLQELDRSQLYIGLFWTGYGDYTIEEFEHARHHGKDCLLYEKRTDIDGRRDERLVKWLAQLDDVENGLTRQWFNTPEELKEFVVPQFSTLRISAFLCGLCGYRFCCTFYRRGAEERRDTQRRSSK